MSRSIWKPIYNKTNNNIITKKKKNNKIFNRNMTISVDDIGQKFKIYNGIRFFDLEIKKTMINHKYGEFAPSRVKPIHKKKKK